MGKLTSHCKSSVAPLRNLFFFPQTTATITITATSTAAATIISLYLGLGFGPSHFFRALKSLDYPKLASGSQAPSSVLMWWWCGCCHEAYLLSACPYSIVPLDFICKTHMHTKKYSEFHDGQQNIKSSVRPPLGSESLYYMDFMHIKPILVARCAYLGK